MTMAIPIIVIHLSEVLLYTKMRLQFGSLDITNYVIQSTKFLIPNRISRSEVSITAPLSRPLYIHVYTCTHVCAISQVYFLANLLASTISLMPRVLFSGTSPSFTSSRVTVGFSVTLEKTFSIHGFWNRT